MITEIRAVLPGHHIEEEGRHCVGIQDSRAVVAGVLCKVQDLYFIKSKSRRYFPVGHDIVIGRIIYTSAEYYKVDVSGYTGYLSVLGFPNAVKRNRPTLEKGDFVAARVTRIEGGDLLLSCKETGLGQLDEVFPIEAWKARVFYTDSFMSELGRSNTFQLVIGMNGFIWLNGSAETRRAVLSAIAEYR